MSVVPLPNDPSLEQLKKQARERQREGVGLSLHDAQLALAREHGFPSWAALKRHVEVIAQHTSRPDAVEPGEGPDELLRLACLTYGDGDHPSRREQARAMLSADPSLRAASIWTAAATFAVDEVRRIVAADPTQATRSGGPFGWRPLLYLAYSRFDSVDEDGVVEIARVLLDAGADPDDGFLWHGLTSPFTALTGAFGGGEGGLVHQPPHPQSLALARTLLESGADPNDAQTLYNRMFFAANDHLELLFGFGLGAGDGGPWRRRLGPALDSPAAMLQTQMWWAAGHHQHERVRLLLRNGVPLTDHFAEGEDGGHWSRSVAGARLGPAEVARLTGDEEMVALLVAAGAASPRLEPVDDLASAVVAVDRARVGALLAADPGLLDRTRAQRPAVVLRAAVDGGAEAVRYAVDLGFDVNAMGRSDTWRMDPWQTALHRAAEHDDTDLASLLLSLGADRTIRDARFDATPADWAGHFGHATLAALLE